jgi:predicted ferric reductase
VTVAPDGHSGLAFEAGQFVWLNIGHGPFSLYENPFSIASAPSGGPEVSFVIKELGDFTRSLDRIAVGTRAYLDGPYGSLTVTGRAEPGIVLIAGGVGIAPVLSILRQLRDSRDPRAVMVIYGNRTEGQIVHRAELEAAGATFVVAEPTEGWQGEVGVADAAFMERVLTPEQIAEWLFVICGPGAMMDGIETYLIAQGTPSHRILTERFYYD